jgi:hypothetical protein
MTAFMSTIPSFMRRPLERAPVRLEIKDRGEDRAAPVPSLPRDVIHGGLPPLQPNFLTSGAAKTLAPLFTAEAPGGDLRPSDPATGEDSAPNPPSSNLSSIDGGVVDLTAHRSAAASADPSPRTMSRALHAAFEAEAGAIVEDDDVAFQVTLPRSVIRQIRLFAAEEGTTHRAVVLRALRTAGLNIPEGADVDRRAIAAKRRHQA